MWEHLWQFSASLAKQEYSSVWLQKIEKDAIKISNKCSKFKNEASFLRYLFHFLHRKYLKTYEKNATWHHLFQKGTYNCVSGVALFAYFLEKSGLSYQIYETENHVFLCVPTQEGTNILIETTAFFTNGLQIFQANSLLVSDFTNLSAISFENLIGIFYYNEAVKAYEKENFVASLTYANKAYRFYPCDRNKKIFALSKERLEKQVAFISK